MPIEPLKVLTEAAKNIEDLSNELAKMQKALNYLLQGNLDFDNIRARGIKADNIEAGAITANEIAAGAVTAAKISVSQLSAISANLGTINVGTLIGVLIQAATIIGSYITTSESYPRSEMNVTQNLIRAMQDPNNYMAMTSIGTGSVPALSLVAAGVLVGFLNRAAGGTTLGTFNSDPLNLQPSGNLQIEGNNGVTGTFYVSATNGGPTDVPVTFRKGIRIG